MPFDLLSVLPTPSTPTLPKETTHGFDVKQNVLSFATVMVLNKDNERKSRIRAIAEMLLAEIHELGKKSSTPAEQDKKFACGVAILKSVEIVLT